MNELLEFLTSKEIMIVYIVAAVACVLYFVIYMVNKNSYKRIQRHNTKELNKLVEQISEIVDEEEPTTPVEVYETPILSPVVEEYIANNEANVENIQTKEETEKEPVVEHIEEKVETIEPTISKQVTKTEKEPVIEEILEEVVEDTKEEDIELVEEKTTITPTVIEPLPKEVQMSLEDLRREYENDPEPIKVTPIRPIETPIIELERLSTEQVIEPVETVEEVAVQEIEEPVETTEEVAVQEIEEPVETIEEVAVEEIEELSMNDELEYTSIEPNREEAQEELLRLTQELEKAEQESKVISLTRYEEDQEENAIISLEELEKKSKAMYASNEITQYADEGNEPISLDDLEKRMQQIQADISMLEEEPEEEPVITNVAEFIEEIEKAQESLPEVTEIEANQETLPEVAEVEQNEPVLMPIRQETLEVDIKEEELQEEAEPIPVKPLNESYQGNSNFEISPVISPIYGIQNKSIVSPAELALENTANYDKLDEEIKKTNEFLVALRELQKNLD